MAKENPPLQATYFSDVVDGDYYTVGITFADYDQGTIKGRWGKNRFLGHSLERSGYHRTEGTKTEIGLDFIYHKCELKADDFTYNRLYGKIVDRITEESRDIVFNKAKDEIVSVLG
jgi:hypothetical protein